MLHVVVAYDVIADRRRNRLAKFLRGYLDRVQKSVFEGEIEEKRFEPMRSGIEAIVDQEEDTVRIFELCGRCIGTIAIIGTGEYVEELDEDIII
jgi:CRISPR-associated protein Cas2